MSETAPKTTAAKKQLDIGETIPVKELRFKDPHGVGMPGKNGAHALRAGKGQEGDYQIDYAPRMRHHRVIFQPFHKEKPSQTVFVPEAWCAWEPASE